VDTQTIFEKPFEFDAYIEERLLSIADLEERAFARQHLVPGLRQIMRESELSYQRLEERVYAEVPAANDRHHVYMTVVRRDQYDITNGAWFPLFQGDEKPWKDRNRGTAMEIPCAIDCVFYRGDGELLHQVTQTGSFEGTVQTKAGTFAARFQLTPTQRYLGSVEHMYRLFQFNGLPWNTLNCGYLLRFLEVRLVEIEGSQAKEEIVDYTVSFGDIEPHLMKNCMPVWNIRTVQYDSQQFILPIIDAKCYEHTFPVDVFGTEHGYLLEGNKDILSVRHTRDQIAIITAEETFQKWAAYQVIQKPPRNLNCFSLPILHNAPKDSFVARYTAHTGIILRSKLEIVRQIEQYDLLDILALQDVTLLTELAEPYDDTHMSVMNVSPVKATGQTYLKLENLNWFVRDDWVNRAEQKVLLFRFVSLSPHFLQYDVLCFLIAQIQRQFIEYRCEAVLELGGERS